MEKYSKYFLLDADTVKEYAKEKVGYFKEEEKLYAAEIGDGNINYVFKVWNPQTGRSLIVKQADTVLRSSGRPLDRYRNKIEAEMLGIESELAEGLVPRIYLYDEIMYAMSMEDISAYKNLRTEMAAGKIFPKLAEDITAFMAGTLLLTTDLILDRAKKKERVKLFMNPELCDITEDLVFTEPYYDYKGRNVILDENRDFVKEKLYGDKELHANVGQLRDGFMNHAQALLHGDLHSGSIFVNQEGTKVIDPEFAFYGPMGYDIGNVIGNLFFAWANKFYTDSGNREFLVWIENTIGEVVDKVREKFNEKWDETVTFPLYTNEEFKKDYIEQVMSDSFGYAGTEIIRRIVGDSKVKEVTDVEDLTLRVPMERALIEIGIKLIKERAALRTGIDIRAVGTKYFC
ncbi:MAG: S-methyl-5-thioribose kinase [Dorea sp.]|nr:S-methyl-5-thioribose kinase [Dorea sp.]MCI9454593.1 S-methyl-5-thioribose kinase [Dorea sp.]